METKVSIQLLHGKCYLCTSPVCSRTANNLRRTAFVEFIGEVSIPLRASYY